MQTADERRSYFRIDDKLFLEFRRIPEEEFVRLRDSNRCEPSLALEWTSESPELHMRNHSGRQDELFSFLQLINRKLDSILCMLSESQGGPHYHSVTSKISISGAGVQFDSDVFFQDGDHAELKIAIPVFPYPKIWTLCEVVRTQVVEDNPGGGCLRIAMKFVVIDERERDTIVNYVFIKEREQLRQKKEVES